MLSETAIKQDGVEALHDIVLIEDDTIEREKLKKFLESNGCSVKAFGDGSSALDYISASNHPHSTVLVDMKLPLRDGATVVHNIRKNSQFDAMPIIGMSGSSLSENGLRL